MPGPFRTVGDLPEVIPVFPLDGALLLPGGQLPLNIFEPRYLNMIDDAMAGARIIGMIQTRGGPSTSPLLAAIGCAGKITSFAETGDGRYLITLTGLCRFSVGDELPLPTPYRQVCAHFSAYGGDMAEPADFDLPSRRTFLEALKAYLGRRNMEIDWETAKSAPADALVNSLAMALPFDPPGKQALLEAAALPERAEVLLALLQIGAAEPDDGPSSVQ